MNAQDLRKRLEDTNDKFNILEDTNIFAKYKMKVYELIDLVRDFLSDEQKAKLFELEHFKKLSSHIKARIIEVISDDNIKLAILENDNIVSEFENYEVMSIVDSLGEEGRVQILHKVDFIQKHDISSYNIQKIMKSLSEEKKRELLIDKDLVEQKLQLDKYEVSELVTGIKDEEIKLDMIDIYEFKNYQIVNILKTFSDESKTSIILEDQYEFNDTDLKKIISTLSVDALVDFIRDNKQFLVQNDINVYEITKSLSKENQLNFVSKMEEIGLNIEEKKKILLTLSKETKNDIDTSKFPLEYVTAIELQISDKFSDFGSYGKIIIDFNKDLEIYRGLDEIICINPMNISTEDKQKLLQLCEICPKISINDDIGLAPSTGKSI